MSSVGGTGNYKNPSLQALSEELDKYAKATRKVGEDQKMDRSQRGKWGGEFNLNGTTSGLEEDGKKLIESVKDEKGAYKTHNEAIGKAMIALGNAEKWAVNGWWLPFPGGPYALGHSLKKYGSDLANGLKVMAEGATDDETRRFVREQLAKLEGISSFSKQYEGALKAAAEFSKYKKEETKAEEHEDNQTGKKEDKKLEPAGAH